ncbi:MAG: hypothetical protein MJH10_18205 [Epibacterium sp.]|nr:hypothetical protein [Epibacterium sp.]NQX75423.1 hypothetical protein [Epibacterium sp.]
MTEKSETIDSAFKAYAEGLDARKQGALTEIQPGDSKAAEAICKANDEMLARRLKIMRFMRGEHQ